MRVLRYSWFAALTAPKGRVYTWHCGGEIDRFLSVVAIGSAKAALPLWSPAVYADHHRARRNVQAVTMLAYDSDAEHASGAEIERKLSVALPGVSCRWHSSWTSRPGAIRARILVDLPRDISADEHALAWTVGRRMLAAGGIETDGACSDPSRAYYIPAHAPGGWYGWGRLDGDPLDVDYAIERERRRVDHARREADAAAEARRARLHVVGDQVMARARAYLAQMPPAISGAHGHDVTFAAALRLTRGFRLSEDHAFALLSEWNQSCQPPWSDRDLRRKVEQAARHGRAPDGWLADRRRA